ncbi:HET-domain-containing protein [Xylariaceae sp. FL1651]|nr:HET-domain-containing protein [Xylariaceae sp. FL1651]
MRLLNVESLELQDFIGILPPYTILSHTWGAEEVTYQDLRNGGLTRLIGFRKLHAVCEQTRRDGFQFTWIDTCCIDKSSSSELNEAINSMYQWYSKASVCYVYMEDVRYADGEELGPTSEFCRSRWFTRGWTLQELIAPSSVTFFDTSWCLIGTKTSLLSVLSVVTGIPQSCLSGEKLLADFSVATRLSWASKRMCTREEDRAYSLMGLFDVYMPLIYGEGENAFLRLQEEIISHTSDQSILAWSVREGDSRCWMPTSVFARSIADFANATGIQPFTGPELHPSVLTNLGLSISLQLVTTSISPRNFKPHISIAGPTLNILFRYFLHRRILSQFGQNRLPSFGLQRH